MSPCDCPKESTGHFVVFMTSPLMFSSSTYSTLLRSLGLPVSVRVRYALNHICSFSKYPMLSRWRYTFSCGTTRLKCMA